MPIINTTNTFNISEQPILQESYHNNKSGLYNYKIPYIKK